MCEKIVKSMQHIKSESENLIQKEYKRRNINVAKRIHWEIMKNGLEHKER